MVVPEERWVAGQAAWAAAGEVGVNSRLPERVEAVKEDVRVALAAEKERGLEEVEPEMAAASKAMVEDAVAEEATAEEATAVVELAEVGTAGAQTEEAAMVEAETGVVETMEAGSRGKQSRASGNRSPSPKDCHR